MNPFHKSNKILIIRLLSAGTPPLTRDIHNAFPSGSSARAVAAGVSQMFLINTMSLLFRSCSFGHQAFVLQEV